MTNHEIRPNLPVDPKSSQVIYKTRPEYAGFREYTVLLCVLVYIMYLLYKV